MLFTAIVVYIANNDFTGPIPTELGKCRDLSKYDNKISNKQTSKFHYKMMI
jgi:hypothetical protein